MHHNTCNQNCIYCYENLNKDIAKKNSSKHNKKSPLLFGELEGDEKVTNRKMESYREGQISFL